MLLASNNSFEVEKQNQQDSNQRRNIQSNDRKLHKINTKKHPNSRKQHEWNKTLKKYTLTHPHCLKRWSFVWKVHHHGCVWTWPRVPGEGDRSALGLRQPHHRVPLPGHRGFAQDPTEQERRECQHRTARRSIFLQQDSVLLIFSWWFILVFMGRELAGKTWVLLGFLRGLFLNLIKEWQCFCMCVSLYTCLHIALFELAIVFGLTYLDSEGLGFSGIYCRLLAGLEPGVTLTSVPFTQITAAIEVAPCAYMPCGGEASKYRRSTDGMESILIPAGMARIGDDTNCPTARENEGPSHIVELSSFLMDIEPVSLGAYARFLNSTTPSQDELFDFCLLPAEDSRCCHIPLTLGEEGWQAGWLKWAKDPSQALFLIIIGLHLHHPLPVCKFLSMFFELETAGETRGSAQLAYDFGVLVWGQRLRSLGRLAGFQIPPSNRG